jgi:uncharacterized protein YdaU (DUF1376 family)
MALRDQPYIPLYIQDFLTDEKLIECSAQATGVYIRLMCVMHKSVEYGKILLKQKDKQDGDQIKNFALKVVKHMPYPTEVVTAAISELLAENVIHIEGDSLCQKRMIEDNSTSLSRAKAGKKGGESAQAKIRAKERANSENEIAIENEIETVKKIKESKNDFYPSDILRGDEEYMIHLDRESVRHKVNLKQALDNWDAWYSNKFTGWRSNYEKDVITMQDLRKSFEAWLRDPKSKAVKSANGIDPDKMEKFKRL